MGKQKTSSWEFKVHLVQLLAKGTHNMSQISRDDHVTRSLLDASSRTCIGWSLARRMDSSLPLQALEMALAQRQVAPGLIHHSDRGRQ